MDVGENTIPETLQAPHLQSNARRLFKSKAVR